MKIQVRRLAIAVAIAVPLAVAATAQSSAAPINGMSIKAAVPAVTTDVRYRAYRDNPYASYSGYPPITTTTDIPTIGPIHRIMCIRSTTVTAGDDARHRQRRLPSSRR